MAVLRGEDPSTPTTPSADPSVPSAPSDPSPDASATGADKVDPQVIDNLTINMLETISTSSSLGIADLYQHQINHARRLDSMAEAYMGKLLKRFSSKTPTESIATAKIFKAESDSSIGSLLAQLSAGQEAAKIAQSTAGDLSAEISKLGSTVASLHGLIGGLVAIIQQTLLNGTEGIKTAAPALQRQNVDPNSTPMPPAPTPPSTIPDEHYNPPSWPPNKKFPSVTIRY